MLNDLGCFLVFFSLFFFLIHMVICIQLALAQCGRGRDTDPQRS